MCGNDNYLLNDTLVDFNFWKKIKIYNITGNDCKYFYEDKEQKNYFYFNMNLGIEDDYIINYLKQNNENNIKLIQDIKVPIGLQYQEYLREDYISTKDYFFCKNNNLININNYQNLKFLCKLEIPRKAILNSEIRISSFFDKIYIKKKENEYEILNIFFNATKSYYINNNNETTLIFQNYLLLNDLNNNNIICPNIPIFTIKTKDSGIYYNSYSLETNKFSFYLKGILTNGYKYINKTLIKISEIYSEISFPLYLYDNSLENSEGNSEIEVQCLLKQGSLFYKEDILIKCEGKKNYILNENNTDDNNNAIIDLNLNYIQNKNNNFSNIIINWPERQYFGNKKNIYLYKISALSFQSKYAICDENNYFIFYINIYNLIKEPKIFFNLPLLSPDGYEAFCELFDSKSLQCSIDLRYKKILKNEKLSLNKKDIRIINNEGNQIIFEVNNKINNFIMKNDCGENVIFGTMKEIGISKKNGIIVSVCIIIFFLILIGFCFFYIIHCFLRCKQKGKKLPMTEESKIHKDDIKL